MAEGTEGRRPEAESTRTIVGALLVGTAAQLLKFLQQLPTVSFFLSLSAALALRRVFAQQPSPAEEPTLQPRPPSLAHRRLGAILSMCGAAGSGACAMALYLDFRTHLSTVLVAGTLTLLALGVGEDLAAGYGLPRRRQSLHAGRSGWALLAILFVGLLFRFGPTGWFPPPDGFASIEEMQRATGGAAILGGSRPWEFPLAQYLAAASFALAGPSIYALRLPVTALAWLTVPLFYLLARRLVDRPAALFATALLATARWHCQVGWYAEDVYVPLFPFVLLLYLLMRTRREPRPSLYVAAGALCGYMLYDYAAYRSAPLVVFLFFAADAIWSPRWPQDWRQIGLLFGVATLFALPLWAVLEAGPGTAFYGEALERSFAETYYYTSDPVLFLQRRYLRMVRSADVFSTSDWEEFFPSLNLPYTPLLDPFTGLFFTLGFGTTLLLWQRRYRAFYAGTFLLLATGSMILPWNLDFRRLAILIPFVFLFTAFLADDVDRQAVAAGWQKRWRWILVLVAVAAGAYNAVYLFLWLAPDRFVRAAHRTPYTVVGGYLQRHYAGEYVLLLSPQSPNFFESNDYDWMKPAGLEGRIVHDVEGLLAPYPKAPRAEILILVTRPYDIRTVLQQVREIHPGADCDLRADPDAGRHDLGVCRLPR